MRHIFTVLPFVLTLPFSLAVHGVEVIPDDQWKTAKDVVAFQPFSEVTGPIDSAQGQLRFINLNTYANSWYLLEVGSGKKTQILNLENPLPQHQKVSMNADGIFEIATPNGQTVACDIVGAAVEGLGVDPYMPLCEGRLYLRNKTVGKKSTVSWVTTNLRSLFGETGDSIVNVVKETLYDGKFFEAGKEGQSASTEVVDAAGPDAAKVSEPVEISDHGIGFELENGAKALNVGQWYKTKNFAGVYVSVMKPKFVEKETLSTYSDRVAAIGSAGGGEGNALVDSLAIDVAGYSFGWIDGTEHPGSGWSPRAQNRHLQSGPDGFDTLNPLTFPGVINPLETSQVVGVLPGGFQRRHAAFKWGPLTGVNRSHHYGFMEKGVVLSTLVPNLASFIVYLDGSIELKTWTLADNDRLNTMRSVRQNGVPLIETDPTTGLGVPSVYVNQWGPGNWSGSANKELKTPRTSACVLKRAGKQFLMISYFTSHSPSAMARVLQAYGCTYAIHLDMNHPVFAFTAFFNTNPSGEYSVEPLSKSMMEGGEFEDGRNARATFLTPTYKDFFYVMKR